MNSLLPPGSTSAEHAADAATARLADVPVPLRSLWDPYTCPEALLPWLAWGLSIDSWKSYWPEEVKRTRVARALEIQRHKGTVRSIRNVITSFGGSVKLREWWQQSPPGDPHTFALILSLDDVGDEATTAKYVDDVIAEVRRTKPVRSHFTFTQGLRAHGGVGLASYARPVNYRRLNFEA